MAHSNLSVNGGSVAAIVATPHETMRTLWPIKCLELPFIRKINIIIARKAKEISY